VIRRYVSRARGRALRAAGVPNLPNVPSARALAQRELRTAVPRGAGRRRASHDADVPAADNPAVRTGGRRDTSEDDLDPYRDTSRDLGEGPDQLTRPQAIVLALGALIGLYVWLHPGVEPPEPTDPPNHCHATCERR